MMRFNQGAYVRVTVSAAAIAEDAKAYAVKGGLLPDWCVPAIEEKRS